MIIQIRGTSGSGKTTAMRQVMENLGELKPVFSPPRKRPLYYRSVSSPLIYILGNYGEAACGGCDTIGSARIVYGVIETLKREEPAGVILAEGLLLSEDVRWTSKLLGAKILFLTTPIEKCLERIRKRRKEAGNDKPLNEANTINRVATIERARLRLLDAGIDCRRCSSDQAPDLVMKYIKEFNH